MDPVVILGTDRIAVGPGEQARLPVRIRNQSRRVESYRVDVVGEAVGFARVEPPTVSVLPGREAELSVLFTPPGGASAPSGVVPFAVRATSEVEAAYSAVAEGSLELAGVTGLQMWAANNAASGRWSGRYQLEFANQGNAATRLSVTGRDPAAALRVSVEHELIDLRPGGRSATQLKAKARHPFLRGSAQNRIVEVRCRKVPFGVLAPEPGAAPDPTDPDQRTLQLTFQQKPVLSKLMLVAIILAAALLLALVVLRLRQTDELALDLAAPEAPSGLTASATGSTSVFLQWDAVPNALGYQIRSTTNTGEMGAEVEVVDAATRTYTVEELDPGSEHCFAVIAVGPEGAANSAPTPHQCVTTNLPSALPPPEALPFTQVSPGVFAMQWTYPDTEGVEFEILVNSTSRPERIVGLSTELRLEQLATAQDVTLAVRAVRGEEVSDPTAPQLFTIEPLPVAETTTPAATTVPGGATTVAPLPTVPGGATTVAPTTTIASPASTVLQDLATTTAAWLGRYTPEAEGGLPLAQRRDALAAQFGIPVTDIGLFSNRDTRVRDAVDVAGDLTNLAASSEFFFVRRPTPAEATALCEANPGRTCGTLTLQGAAAAAEGTTVVVVARLDAATTSIAELDAAIDEQRDRLETQNVFALDGGNFQGFSANEIIVYVSDLGTQIDTFCADRIDGPCATATITRQP